MNLSSTLTTRDKKLLYMLVFVVIIFVFGWYIIRPLYKRTAEDQERIRIESALRSSNEAKVIGLASAEELTEKFASEYTEDTSIYYDYMDSSEIDKLVTTYILKRGLLARDLTISMPTDYVSESPYIYSDITSVQDIVIEETAATDTTAVTADTADTKPKTGSFYKEAVLGFLTGYETQDVEMVSTPMEEYSHGQRTAGSTSSSGLLCVQLSIVVEGDAADEQAIIDDLTHNPSVRVTGFNWITMDPVTYLLDDGSILVVESEMSQLHISVNLYMNDIAE